MYAFFFLVDEVTLLLFFAKDEVILLTISQAYTRVNHAWVRSSWWVSAWYAYVVCVRFYVSISTVITKISMHGCYVIIFLSMHLSKDFLKQSWTEWNRRMICHMQNTTTYFAPGPAGWLSQNLGILLWAAVGHTTTQGNFLILTFF
jgi:hypothetical protein